MFSWVNRLRQLASGKPQKIETFYFDLDNIPPCPTCGSDNVAIFIYGKPPLERAILEGLESGKIISGGCMIRVTAPKWHCYQCKNDFGRLR